MDTLPTELFCQILDYLSASCRKNARLASRRFNAILAEQSFVALPSFIDPDVALSTLESTVSNLSPRPRSIWSPRCSVPDCLPVARSFLLAVHVALAGQSWHRAVSMPSGRAGSPEWDSESSEADSIKYDDDITVQSLGRRLGRNDMTEEALRQAMFRYALYLSYHYKGSGEAPQLWVLNTELWATKA